MTVTVLLEEVHFWLDVRRDEPFRDNGKTHWQAQLKLPAIQRPAVD